ncbi:MAG: hypothetical protein JF599_00260 [Verrucomicrobia bacterium]|nr:hypothetical protein [Verrucomicrobiota bacterium]
MEEPELVAKRGPLVPKIIADAPHVGVGDDVLSTSERRGAGRGAEDDVLAAAITDGVKRRFIAASANSTKASGRPAFGYDAIDRIGITHACVEPILRLYG